MALFWSYEGYNPPHAIERVVPTGSMQLIVDLREGDEGGLRVYDRQDHRRFRNLGGSLLSGAHSCFVVIDTASQASTVGVHFRPSGAFPFLGLPAGSLRDAEVPLDALWGTKAAELRGRLLEARTPEARFCVLERALLARAARPLTRHPAVALALIPYSGRSMENRSSNSTASKAVLSTTFSAQAAQFAGQSLTDAFVAGPAQGPRSDK